MKRATMSDVARRAGVSPMTVSRALKPGSPVSPETRARIETAAAELGYILDARAAALSSLRSGFAAVIVPSLNNSNFADTVRGLTEALDGSGLELLIGYTDYDTVREEKVAEAMLRRRPEVMILTGGTHSQRCRELVSRSGVPVIEIWDLPKEPLGHVVGFSNAETSAEMVYHLAQTGYRRLGFIGGDTQRDPRGAERRRGFLEVVRQLGLPEPAMSDAGQPPITPREGARAFRDLWERWPGVEAVLCVSDLSAFGALTEAQRMGLRVPDDLALAGFGAFDISEVCNPRITTTAVGALTIGQRAGGLALDAIRGELAEPALIRVPVQVLHRESTAGTALPRGTTPTLRGQARSPARDRTA